MSRIDPTLNNSTDADLSYDPFVDDDAELRGGILFPWSHASILSQAHQIDLKPPGGGGGGGGGGGHGGSGGGGVPSTQAVAAYAGPSLASVGSLTGYYMIPPDNASAVSESAAVLAVNGEVQVYQRSGTNGLGAPVSTTLDKFFGGSGLFDPRVIYDPVSHKIVVTAVDQSSTGDTSDMWVAVSTDATAQHFAIQHFNTALTANGALSWADFPQVGLDTGGNLYLTANLFDFATSNYQGSRLWIVNESAVASTQQINPAPIDPSAPFGLSGQSELFSLAPAYMPAADANYPGVNGDYLVTYNSATSSSTGHNVLDVVHVTSSGTPSLFEIDVGGLIDQLNENNNGLMAPQPGTTTQIMADDSRTASVVYKNGFLYVAASILPASGPDAGHATAHWWVMSVDPTSGDPIKVVNQGDISGNTYAPTSNLRSYYPSLAVDANGNMAVSFSGSAPASGTGTNGQAYTGNPSAYEVTVPDAAHTTTTEVGGWKLVEAGVANYVRTLGYGENRWGDYSSISLDPNNPGHFWAFNEYAMAHGLTYLGENGLWGTELGYF